MATIEKDQESMSQSDSADETQAEIPQAPKHPSEALPFSEQTSDLLRDLIESKERSIPTFSEGLDYNLNGGLRRKTLVTITSENGEGKTTFGWQLAQHVAENGRTEGEFSIPTPVMYVSMEMARSTLFNKALSRLGRIDGGVLSGRQWLDIEEVDEKERVLKDIVKANHRLTKFARHIRVIDIREARPGRMTIRDIRNQARAFRQAHHVRMENELMSGSPDPQRRQQLMFALEKDPHLVIFVDHLQLLRNTNDPSPQGYLDHDAAMTYDLKHLAVRLNCTVVALSQIPVSEERPLIHGADMTAVLRTGYSVIEDKLKAFSEASQEMKGAAEEDREEWERDRSGHRRLKSQKPLQAEEGSPVFAALDVEKNREGRTRDTLFVWRRAFHEFEEVAMESDESKSLRRFLPWEQKTP
ncbi:MAG: AAA family ATPase [Candidatus Latescibacteria bacterium]|jgi:replicative DNA helicase|nr:AAA family ATPase [Candidatus Latescibacterota bacterium]